MRFVVRMASDLGWWVFGTGRYEESIEHGLRALELDPRYSEAHWVLAHAHAYLGNAEESLANLDRYEEPYGAPLPYFRAYFLAVLGQPDGARALIPEIRARIDSGLSHWSELALVYAALGDIDLALDAAERIDRRRISFMPYHTPGWQTLYDEPRFQAVLERTGFPPPPARP